MTALASELAALGVDVTVVAPADKPGTYQVDGYRLKHFRRLAVWGGTPIFNPLVFLRRAKEFDLIHSQATYPLLSDMSPFIAKLIGVPSVVTFHFEPTPTTPKMRLIAGIYFSTLERLILLNDRVIFSTESYRRRTRLFGPDAEPRIRYIPMGVDTGFFAPGKTVRREKRFLFVGRLVPYKDIPLLLRAFSQVRKALPDYELCIVGEGPLELELKAAASAIGGVRFLGKISDEDLRDLYRSSVATVLSSHDKQEAFGMTLLESMACGTPPIATDIPGVREVAALGGMVVAPESEEALAQAMIEAAEASGQDITRAMELHSRVEESYSWRAVASKTRDLYAELLGIQPESLTQNRSAIPSVP